MSERGLGCCQTSLWGVPGRECLREECLREGWGAARLVCGGVPGRECLREGWGAAGLVCGGVPGRECLREGWGAVRLVCGGGGGRCLVESV